MAVLLRPDALLTSIKQEDLRPATVLSKELAQMSISNRSDGDSAVAPQQLICAALVTNSNRSDGDSAVAPQQRICAALGWDSKQRVTGCTKIPAHAGTEARKGPVPDRQPDLHQLNKRNRLFRVQLAGTDIDLGCRHIPPWLGRQLSAEASKPKMRAVLWDRGHWH